MLRYNIHKVVNDGVQKLVADESENGIWVLWSDVKPIIDEYNELILQEVESVTDDSINISNQFSVKCD